MTNPTPPFLPSARPPVASGTNTMAVLAIVFAFLVAPLGIVFGAIGRSQTAKTGQKGKGLATAGLVLGIIFTLVGAAAIVVAVVVGGKNTAVSKSSMETEISDQLAASGQPRPDSVSCPGSLRAEVGKSMDCTVTSSGRSFGVVATVTSVSGSTVRFGITSKRTAAAEAPTPSAEPTSSSAPAPSTTTSDPAAQAVPQATVESQISEQLKAAVGSSPDSVTCPGDLPARVGASLSCSLTAEGTSLGVTVTVTTVDGGVARFTIKVDS